MRIWFDTEFIDTGSRIELISIGMVREDDARYYAEVAECDRSLACEWVRENVFPHLSGDTKPRAQIAEEVRAFAGDSPEFWAWYGAHDWVVLTQLYGRMINAPESWPQFVRDFCPEWHDMGRPILPGVEMEHHALADALWLRKTWEMFH